MTKKELNKYAKVLDEKHAELTKALRNREGIKVEKTADAVEAYQQANQQKVAIRNLDQGSNILHSVREARTRIKEGSYGTCLECAGDISPKRLAAVPWAELCIKCQEKTDRNTTQNAA